MGYPSKKEEIINIMAHLFKVNDLKTHFRNGVLGTDWYYSFMKRHPSLSFKKPEHLQKNRKDARKPDIIYDFYSELNALVEKPKPTDTAAFVFNCDESGFSLDPKRMKAIGEKGKPLFRVSGGSGRKSVSVLALWMVVIFRHS